MTNTKQKEKNYFTKIPASYMPKDAEKKLTTILNTPNGRFYRTKFGTWKEFPEYLIIKKPSKRSKKCR